MVVNENSPKRDEPTEEERRQAMIDAISKESNTVLTFAYMYAKGFDLSGTDITKRWSDIVMQNDALNRAYRKGFNDALDYIREQKEQEQE